MDDHQKKQRTEQEAEIEREIRDKRKFSLAEAIGRLAGPGAMKGTSPVPLKEQAAHQVENWLNCHLPGNQMELQLVLLRDFRCSELLLHNFEQPFVVLAAYCQQIIDSEYLLQ